MASLYILNKVPVITQSTSVVYILGEIDVRPYYLHISSRIVRPSGGAFVTMATDVTMTTDVS